MAHNRVGLQLQTEFVVPRHIVPDLSQSLGEQLQQAGASLLVVLPGGDASAEGPGDGWKIDFATLQKVQGTHVCFARNYQQFLDQRRALFRTLRLHDEQSPGGVALLLRGSRGASGLAQAALAAAIVRHVRRHVLTLAYSTHEDKGDSLVAFSPSGEPTNVTFMSTQIFRDAFNAVYEKKMWGHGGGGSGSGSELSQTEKIRRELLRILQQYNISSMLDSSCGSMHWMPLVLENATAANRDFKFMGTDVVCNLTERHKTKWPQWSFACVDYSNQPLPSGYDLVFSRDSLQHLPMHATWQFLNNVRNSGARYLLVGSYVKAAQANTDITAGDYYPINLLKPPFSLSQPVEVIDEETSNELRKHMLLFDVASMKWQDPLHGLV